MKKFIATTTIHAPTPALQRFAAMNDWHLVAAGDLKTPQNWKIDGATYLSPEDQRRLDPALSERIGWNCLQRRNFAIIWAIQNGAECVALVDDDNIPYANWGLNHRPGFEIEVDYYRSDSPAFDPVGATDYSHLWHRGFPIQWLHLRNYSSKCRRTISPDVVAGFWDGDPDIDAICRMEHRPDVSFNSNLFPLAGDGFAPFNSQNTILTAAALRHYFLFPGIGRMDDIWAAFWLQSKGAKVVFTQSSVRQERNPHDLTRDLQAEVLGHLKSHELIMALQSQGPEAIWDFLPDGSREIYCLYQRHFEA